MGMHNFGIPSTQAHIKNNKPIKKYNKKWK